MTDNAIVPFIIELSMSKEKDLKDVQHPVSYLIGITFRINNMFEFTVSDKDAFKGFDFNGFSNKVGGNSFTIVSIKDNVFSVRNQVSGCGGDSSFDVYIQITDTFRMHLKEVKKFLSYCGELKDIEGDYSYNGTLNIKYENE